MKTKAKRVAKNGAMVWCMDLGIRATSGKRIRIFRKTKEAVEQAANDLVGEQATFGAELAQISVAERAFLRRWTTRMTLDQMESTLTSAYKVQPVMAGITMTQATDRYFESRKATCKSRHVANMRFQFRAINAEFGPRPLSSIRPGELDTFVRSKGASGPNCYSHLMMIFNYALLYDWVDKNPMTRVPKPVFAPGEKDVFTDKQMRSCLSYCIKTSDFPMLKVLVLGGFCGMRYAEVMRLTGQNVDLTTGEIHVEKMKTETRGIRERFVTLIEPAKAWLAWCEAQKPSLNPGPSPKTNIFVGINDKNLRTHREAMCKAVGIKAWPTNVLRRSFGSYHLAAYENGAATAAIMGHTTADTTYAKYRKARRKADGDAWFALTPEKVTAADPTLE